MKIVHTWLMLPLRTDNHPAPFQPPHSGDKSNTDSSASFCQEPTVGESKLAEATVLAISFTRDHRPLPTGYWLLASDQCSE